MNIREIRSQRMKVDLLRERIECIQADIERTTQVPRNAPGGNVASDKLSAKVAKLVDLKAELADEVVALEAGIRAAEDLLTGLPEQQRRIMWLRYAEGLSWGEIAKRTRYSRHHCLCIHARALDKIAEKITA